ncbi:hypothetical protein C8T65DRAFT_702949, partial [Cerioporus squamosus]
MFPDSTHLSSAALPAPSCPKPPDGVSPNTVSGGDRLGLQGTAQTRQSARLKEKPAVSYGPGECFYAKVVQEGFRKAAGFKSALGACFARAPRGPTTRSQSQAATAHDTVPKPCTQFGKPICVDTDLVSLVVEAESRGEAVSCEVRNEDAVSCDSIPVLIDADSYAGSNMDVDDVAISSDNEGPPKSPAPSLVAPSTSATTRLNAVNRRHRT